MRMLLRARSLHSRPARTWVVHEGGKLRAYLCAAAPDPRRRGGVWEVLESGGSRPAVLACLPAILRACATSLIEVETTIRDAEMEGLARDYRIPVRARGFRGTLKIIDTPRFLRSIQGYVRQGLPSRDRVRLETSASGGVRLAVGAEELLLRTDREAAAFFFGSLETPPSVSARGRLRQAVDRLFPLPLPVYGLNYI
jgi:hypothetical protein